MKTIRVICVNYNNSKYTEDLLQSLLSQKGLETLFQIRLSIVDNSSDVGDAKRMHNFSLCHKTIDYFRPENNLGYFGGLNFAFKECKESNPDFVVICNNDLQFDPDFVFRLLSQNYAKNVFAICPDVVTKDGIHQNPHALFKISWFRRLQFDLYFSNFQVARLMLFVLKFLKSEKTNFFLATEEREIYAGIGAIYVLTKEFLNRFRELHFPHFLYGEEAYFSHQIHSAGGILWFDPNLHVDHAESATLSKIPKRTAYEFARSGYPSYRKML